MPVGRLDRDTTGALLLTNDGDLAHRLAHPRYGVEKVYVADVEGEPDDDDDPSDSREGIELEDGPTAPARVRRLGPLAARARAPRGPEPPGAAHVRGGRASRCAGCIGPLRRPHAHRAFRPGELRDLTPAEVTRLRRLVGLAGPGREGHLS